MPVIKLITEIHAPIALVFDLSRSVDLHKLSTARSDERVVAGRSSGLVEAGDTITWRARHLGIYQNLTSHITEVVPTSRFTDRMERGAFKRFTHTHLFESDGVNTLMRDEFDYTSPFGILGVLADKLFLEKYMAGFLAERNSMIKQVAESDQWKQIPGMKSSYP